MRDMETKHSSQPVANDSDDDMNTYVMIRMDDAGKDIYFVSPSDDDAIVTTQIAADDWDVAVKVSRVEIMDMPIGDVREKVAIVHPQF